MIFPPLERHKARKFKSILALIFFLQRAHLFWENCTVQLKIGSNDNFIKLGSFPWLLEYLLQRLFKNRFVDTDLWERSICPLHECVKYIRPLLIRPVMKSNRRSRELEAIDNKFMDISATTNKVKHHRIKTQES